MTSLLKPGKTYEEIYANFKWDIPDQYNIADDVCDRWADGSGRIALAYENEAKETSIYTFDDVKKYANQLANAFQSWGFSKGDRVTLLLAQNPECAIGHVACWKAGMVSGPCSVLFAGDAVAYRLNDCGAKAVITDLANFEKVNSLRSQCPKLEKIIIVDGDADGAFNFWNSISSESEVFENAKTAAEDIAWISYTSGTTGQPKGSVQPHRMMLGHMPSLEFIYDFFPQDADALWSPADWAWMAGLMDVLMPGWFHGCKVVATAMKGFDAEDAYRILAEHEVTLALLTPTMLKLMRQVEDPLSRHTLKLRSVLSGGEAVGAGLLEWAQGELNLAINEGFGQTECNVILGNNGNVFPIKPGSLGKPTPGSVVKIIDDSGTEVPCGQEGHIACQRPHPVMLLEYLNKPEATKEKFIGDMLITGDVGHMDEDGYFWFHGRGDDVITSSGYRIGPSEIEDALLKHEAIQMAAAIGIPDPVRTEIIKVFLILKEGVQGTQTLQDELKEFVRSRLAKHEVPRIIEFVESLPMTTTGKIMRRELRELEKEKLASTS
ncbi:MAG: AMP-binding protein [Gammaproteobacteria bacterium]|jgi:acetyl-CoA synthetase|tara:strand:- start:53 stop:1699 length:1647 start_codon:yes stop_codon:yes gene_type:complete